MTYSPPDSLRHLRAACASLLRKQSATNRCDRTPPAVFQALHDAAGDQPPVMLVVPANLGGSVEHFYHFLFGYLLPFLEHCHGMRSTHHFHFRTCGPMDRLLRELEGFHIETVPVQEAVPPQPPRLGRPCVMVPGFDKPHAYVRSRLARVRRVVGDLLGERIASAGVRFPASASDRLVLVVDRAPSPAFYLSPQAEIPLSGAQRRSVPNMAEVLDAVASRHDAILVRLEELSLIEQIHLFSRAWRVIGQHGAGLAHMIFARPDAMLVEIQPATLVPHALDYFSALCEALGIDWRSVNQVSNHAAVAPEDVLAHLA